MIFISCRISFLIGFCLDTCKFLHDRGDYKTGWQLEKEWDEKQKNGAADEENYEINEDEEDNLPFACYICRDEFVDPVVTNCEHYFCEKCILAEFKKSHKCPICSNNTEGILKVAKNLLNK